MMSTLLLREQIRIHRYAARRLKSPAWSNCLRHRTIVDQKLQSPFPRSSFSNKSNSRAPITKSHKFKLSSSSSSPSLPPPSFEGFLIILAARVISAFGLVHIVSEHCIEMTRCEGPSMMPTIQPSGEIILIEKVTHRIYGLDGGDCAEKKVKVAREKQLLWEEEESRLWQQEDQNQKNKTRTKSSLSNSKSIRSSIQTHPHTISESSSGEVELSAPVHTWHESKLEEVNESNFKFLSSMSKCVEKLTSGVCVGDVVVVQHPDRDGTVCKRVLGLPGDMILRPKSTLYSNNGRYVRRGGGGRSHRDVMDVFQDGNGQNNFRGSARRSISSAMVPSLHNSSLIVVPDGHIWLEGDNSMNSSDSRNYGPLPASLIVGKVVLRLWPVRGRAMMVRGSCPIPPEGIPFNGSTRLPAGYEGEHIRLKKRIRKIIN